jgi:cytochrome c-type biogenesis protein CcsB
VTETLADYSLVAVYTAIAVYVLAFILFTLDLSRRSVEATRAADRRVSAAAIEESAGSTAVLVETAVEEPAPKSAPRYLRAAIALTWMGWIIHVAAAIGRGVAAGRVPWANMFEFSLTATAVIVGVFLFAQFWQDLRYLGAFITGLVIAWLGVAVLGFYVDVAPLQPALQSVWLVLHIIVAVLGTSFYALGAGLSIVQLLRNRRDQGGLVRARFLDTVPSTPRLEDLAYRVIVVGFVFWTFTLIAGAIWANAAWGRYWGWDTKEVWTFVIWVIYAGYIHARATRGWRGTRSAWLAIIGFSAVLFNFTIVNVFFKGLHAYSGL